MKRIFSTGAIVFLAIAAIAGTVFFGLGFFLSPQSKLENADAIVAISGGETAARAEEAVQLYQEGWSKHIIFSGAAEDKSGPSNAEAMRREAISLGVPKSDIEVEELSASTKQNAQYVKKIIDDAGYKSIILVTSPYHQRRAYISFSRALGDGVKIMNHSAVDKGWRRSKWWATPHSFALTMDELQKTIFLMLGGNPV